METYLNTKKCVFLVAMTILLSIPLFPIKKVYAESKVILIGIDSADWDLINYFIKKGEAPHFRDLMHRGAQAYVSPGDDKDSPVNWTTVATGYRRDAHKISFLNYYDTDRGFSVPYLSTQRQKRAFWNILTENNIKTGVVGWPVSWPAEKVNGFFVSAYKYFDSDSGNIFPRAFFVDLEDMFYPASIKEPLREVVRMQESLYSQRVRDITDALVSESEKNPIKTTLWNFLTDDIYQEIGQVLYKEMKPRVLAVYLEGLHRIGHNLSSPNSDVQKGNLEVYGDVLGNYYRFLDRVLGDYVSLADPETTIIVVSDRGMSKRGQHTANGFFLIAGPSIKKNAKSLFSISLADVTPTILYVMGLPVAKDMDGNVFRFVFEKKYLKTHPIKRIQGPGEFIPGEYPSQQPFARKEVVRRAKVLNRQTD